jgi:hypothetical protein
MLDTLWRHDDPAAIDRLNERMKNQMVAEIDDPDECKAASVVRAPQSVSGTSLLNIGPRP